VVSGLIRYAFLLLGFLCLASASAAIAQGLRDPTRPPFGSGKSVSAKSNYSGWNLQSVLISPERRYAIINSEIVAIGGSVGGAELVAIAAERVTLRTRDGLRILRLFPDVTRLDDLDDARTTLHMPVSESPNDTTVHGSGNSGMNNEKTN
jgi:MSHA biogenesis protein MshK